MNISREDIGQLAGALMNHLRATGGSASKIASKQGPSSDDIDKGLDKLKGSIKKSNDVFTRFSGHVGKVVNVAGSLQRRLEGIVDSIEENGGKYHKAAKLVAQRTMQEVKTRGILDRTMHQNIKQTERFRDAMAHYINVNKKLEAVENLNLELKKEEAKVAKTAGKAKFKKEHAEAVARAEALREQIKEFGDLREEVANAAEMVHEFGAGLDATSISLSHMDRAVVDNIRSGKILNESMDDAKKIHENLSSGHKAHTEALLGATEQVANSADSFGSSLVEVAKMIKGAFDVTFRAVDKILDNYESQLKNNITESHYLRAGQMGVSDGELSNILGQNTLSSRALTQSRDPARILDGGTLNTAQDNVGRLFGLRAGEALNKVFKLRDMAGATGSNLSAKELEAFAAQMKGMAMDLGMTTDEVETFRTGLEEAGTLQLIAAKYDGLSAKKRSEAINKDIGAILYHGRVLGMSSVQITKAMNTIQGNKFSPLAETIQKQVAAKIAVGQLRGRGIGVSAATERGLQDEAMGLDTEAARTAKQQIGVAAGQVYTSAEARAKAGDPSSLYGAKIFSQIQATLGSDIGSQANVTEAMQADQRRRGMGDATSLMQMPDVIRNSAISMKDFNSHFAVFEDQLLKARDIVAGVKANPAYEAGSGALGAAMEWGGTALQVVGLQKLLGPGLARMLPGLAGGGGAAGGIGGTLARLVPGLGGGGAGAAATAGGGLLARMGAFTGLSSLGGLLTTNVGALAGAGAGGAAATAGGVGLAAVGGYMTGEFISDQISTHNRELADTLGSSMTELMAFLGSDTAQDTLDFNKRQSERPGSISREMQASLEETDPEKKKTQEEIAAHLETIAKNTATTSEHTRATVEEQKKTHAAYRSEAEARELIRRQTISRSSALDRVNNSF